MKTKRKTPDIRFRGFSDDWEQRKLGEVTESYSGGTPTAGKKEYYDGDIPFIRSGEIGSDKTEFFISEEGLNSSSAKMVKAGDILYALYGATSGEVSISKLKGAINQAILAIQPHKSYDSQFLMQWLRKSKENIIGTYLQGGQGNLSGNIVKELVVDVPRYEEQKEIGAYLKNLDHLITLHQRKLQQLKEVKRGMLLKMFAEKTKSKPSVRLSGFDGLWEQTRYNAIVNYESSSFSRNEFPDEISETGYPVFDANNLVARIGQYDQGNNYISILKDGAGVGRLSLREGKSSVIGTMGYIVPKEVDVYFLYYLTKNIKFTKYINGSTIPHLYFKDYGEEKVKFAKDIKEQEEVGRFFQKLDRVIELQEREIELLEETKKGFLQKMFV